MNIKTLISMFIVVCVDCAANAQTASQDRIVTVTTTAVSKNSISFEWSGANITNTSIYRKLKTSNSWSPLANNLSGTTYTDRRVKENQEYEYCFEGNFGAMYGYVSAGYQLTEVTSRGDILVVLDTRLSSGLNTQMEQLTKDLISDGWNPILIEQSSSSSISALKTRIDSVHSLVSLESVYLIGHLPVPYSGNFAPDGHIDHLGAWPTDLYYVTPTSDWSDNTVT
jgi:hypothetical protein